MSSTVKKILMPLASLRLTVVLLVLTMIVVFAGTLAQRFTGIWQVQTQYFHSFFTWIEIQNLLPFVKTTVPGRIPMLGGYSLLVLLLVNLVAAHTVRFKFGWKRVGVILIHFGIILLLVGELVTSLFARETQMTLTEGDASSWSHDIREAELAFVDTSPADHDDVIVVSEGRLMQGGTVQDPKLPFALKIDRYYPNSDVLGPMQPGAAGNQLATAGSGVGLAAVGRSRVTGTEGQNVDIPSGFVTPMVDGKPLGTYLVTVAAWDGMLAKLNRPQMIEANGKTYEMQLRFRRYYHPYQVALLDFSHDKYTGTDRARNFASRVRLSDPAQGVQREVTVRMNEPLRYAGDTFYQAGFVRGNDRITTLQVVRNPGWLMPYVACAIGALGMVIHFGMNLVSFLRRRAKESGVGTLHIPGPGFVSVLLSVFLNFASNPPRDQAEGKGKGDYALPPKRSRAAFAVPAAVLGICLVYLISHLAVGPYKGRDGVDVDRFAKVPVSFDGRPMPLDAVARGNLKIISGRESIKTEGGRVPAIQWLTDMLAGNDRSREYKVFRIDHPQIKALLDLNPKEKLFSWDDLVVSNGNGEKLMAQVRQAGEVPEKQRDLYQRKVLELYQHLARFMRFAGVADVVELYDLIRNPGQAAELDRQAQAVAAADPKSLTADQQRLLMRYERLNRQMQRIAESFATEEGRKDDLFFGVPEQAGQEFQGITLGVKALREGKPVPESVQRWLSMLGALRDGRPSQFNGEVAAYLRDVSTRLPKLAGKSDFEQFFHRFDPFTMSIVFYLIALVLAAGSWLGWSRPLGRAALAVLGLTLLVHTFGLVARMYISGRPPVTNLYSSAIFIGWGGIVLCLALEAIYRNGVGSVSAAVLGFATLLIADRLDVRDADTMAQLEAVLDTNFWLATHVVVITLGYASTFLAGLLAIVYVLGGVFSPDFDAERRKDVSRMVYGVLCFATLASFVGTILGGIWADQSWGRFWGWDPKENGAVLIVLWNALILHARWGGVVRERGVIVLAIAANIVTAWSWFGTNMLGVGLHSYGFMEGAVPALLSFWASQLALMGIGMLPLRMWRSYVAEKAPVTVTSAKGKRRS